MRVPYFAGTIKNLIANVSLADVSVKRTSTKLLVVKVVRKRNTIELKLLYY